MTPPVDPTVILPFLAAAVLMEITPGPNMSWLALVSLTQGRKTALAAVTGITLGLTFWMVAAAFGLTTVVMRWPPLYQVIRWAGVIFILYLAFDAWRSTSTTDVDAHSTANQTKLFRRGLIGNLLNPKAALLYVVLLPGFIRPEYGTNLIQALTLGSLHVFISVVVHAGIVMTASGAGSSFVSRFSGPVMRAAMALSLVAVAIWTAWETRL